MFRIVTGPLGSGKSYYCVNYLKKFATYDKIYDVMILDSDVLLVTNIDEIKVNHLSIKEFRDNNLQNIENLKKYLKVNRYRRVIYIHDEAQRVYGGVKDNEEIFFLEYSRHLGIDIFMMVQSAYALPKRIIEIAEYIIDARPQTISITGFQYDLKDTKTGNILGKINLKKDKDVFRLYKSFDFDEIERPKKLILRKLVIAGSVMALAVVFMYVTLKYLFKSDIEEHSPGNKTSMSIIQTPKPKKKQEIMTKTPNEVRKEPYYVLMDNNELKVRPNGKIRGVAETEYGTYIFYEN